MKNQNLILIVLAIAVAMATVPSVGAQSIGGDQGYYYIASIPSGATVSVDGTNVGTTPTTATVYTTGTPGHTIEVSMDGYQDWIRTNQPNPAAGQTVTVTAQLVPIIITIPTTSGVGGQKGYYSISSSPTGSVTFDGNFVGSTPVIVDVSTDRYAESYPRYNGYQLSDLPADHSGKPCCRSDNSD